MLGIMLETSIKVLIAIGQPLMIGAVTYSAFLIVKYKSLGFWFDAQASENRALKFLLIGLFGVVSSSVILAVLNQG